MYPRVLVHRRKWLAAVVISCLLMWAVHYHLPIPGFQGTPLAAAGLKQHGSMDFYPAGLGLSSLQGEKLVMVAYTNSAYLDWALNWAAYCNQLKLKFMIIASDINAVATLQLNGILVYDATAAAEAQPYLATASMMRFRDRSDLMRQMGHVKVKTALQLMRQYEWDTMVLTDTDTAWFKDPSILVKMYPDADVMVSTDCLSAHHDRNLPRCHMLPGGWTSAWNTGVVVVRNTPAALDSLQEWADRLTPDAPSKTVEGWIIEDQLAYSNVLDEGSLPWLGVDTNQTSTLKDSSAQTAEGKDNHGTGSPGKLQHAADGRNASNAAGASTEQSPGLVWGWNKQLKVLPLPPLVLANGQVYMEQRLPERFNVTPVGVHNTFQTYHANDGKLSRMRENNMWLVDPPEHYMGRFLTYDNMVEFYIDRVALVWQQQTGREMVLLHKHLLAAAFQIQVLAEALAAARALQRLLIPPRFVCYCWQDVSAYTDMLNTCRMEGTDRPMPVNCSASFFINVAETSYLQHLRYPNFLDNSNMQDAVQHSSVRVQITGERWLGSTAGSSSFAAASKAGGALHEHPTLPLHVSDEELVSSLAGHSHMRVLYLGGLAPGWLIGLTSQSDVDWVKDLMYNLTAMSGWCCLMTESIGTAIGQDMKHAYVGYQWPQISTADARRDLLVATNEAIKSYNNEHRERSFPTRLVGLLWRPVDALFTMPDWCAPKAGYLKPYNLELTKRPQHPCSYLAGFTINTGLRDGLDAALMEVHQLRVAAKQAGAALAAAWTALMVT